ncbi:hypothetical protein [Aphanothece sacrum]|uniref:Glycosyl transferase n=1 Tax=Aphanothece sacrum FPU1 TaxID=1920663 RepID=A0A401IHV4_APHSA|nr:hypothetical protein [Aphanothece sacrum]GBF80711.1 hypothetical protein AsFPU1_2115 [Aphanothece sacrum FPU1]GBF83205.1 hypothetical protein AsFPU3_0244 [Aphanothece sacrum FPU3]
MTINHSNLDCCLCGLALGSPYRQLARTLSQDLAEKAPNLSFVVLTDNPREFGNLNNVIAIQHNHYFGYRPYNDKVFVLEAALERFSVAIQVDVDITLTENILEKINQPWPPGITAMSQNLLEHTQKNNIGDISSIEKLAQKLDLRLEEVRWVGEHMFIIKRDNGKEKEFFALWKKLAYYWDIHKLGAKDGTLIGLAGAKVGWQISFEHWQPLNQCLEHFDVHLQLKYSKLKEFLDRWSYRSRIVRAHFFALAQSEFYYK